jgi:hypothetical protein
MSHGSLRVTLTRFHASGNAVAGLEAVDHGCEEAPTMGCYQQGLRGEPSRGVRPCSVREPTDVDPRSRRAGAITWSGRPASRPPSGNAIRLVCRRA